MKFMVSSRHPLGILKDMEEIKVNYIDIERLRDFVSDDWTCAAEVNIYIPRDQIIDWNVIEAYKEILNLTLAVEDTDIIQECKDRGFKVFWSYPASTYWELRGLLDLGVNEVLLDAPLYFDLQNVKNICGDVEIRIQVNKCYNNYMKRKNGICGTYVRPEDVEIYAEYVSHMEFVTDSLETEHTLYKIYAQQKHWPGNLNLLLTGLGLSVDNRGFEIIPNVGDDPKAFAHRRIKCGQKCQNKPYSCHYCEETFRFIRTLDINNVEIKQMIDALPNNE